MDKKETFEKITSKKEFSKLPKIDVEKAFEKFERREVSDAEKIRLTRELLHKTYGAFASRKILSFKDKDEEWILRKHLSTRERLEGYEEVYLRLLEDFKRKNISVIDLGCGVNGFSYKFFNKLGFNVDYVGVEGVGQLVDLMNFYFKSKRISGKAIHESLFNLKEIKKIISGAKKPRFVFLFKVLDSLEMVERDYSKKFLEEVVSLSERVVVSFATRSMSKKTKFRAKRNWVKNFIEDNFNVLDEFEISGERYLVFEK